MATVVGESYLTVLKIDKKDLIPPPHKIGHVGGKNLQVIGCYPVFITHNGQLVETLVFFTKNVENMYISLDVCKDICIIDKNFPHNNTIDRALHVNNIKKLPQPDAEEPAAKEHYSIPTKPDKLPFEPTEENLDNLENYFLKTFKNTTFKTTGPLPAMSGGPATIHLQKDAIPHQVTVPIPLPHQIKKALMMN